MDKVTCRITVFFEEPFWIGVFEHISHGNMSVCKVTFGAEPKDYELYRFVLKEYDYLQFSPAVTVAEKERPLSPKRRQRNVKHHLEQTGIGTKSQQALKLQQEQNKTESRQSRRKEKKAEEERMFYLKQRKRREKHKGH